jgi:NAD(P)-dependent dehydrogenase (short-subunit alcohol dehydrogenase family)
MKLKNRVAIITGGGRGIGEAIALAFAKEGANLTLVSRTASEIENVAKAIKEFDGEALELTGDISEERTADEVVAKTIEKYSKLDILVNCAGIYGPIGRFDKNDLEEWKYTMNVNFLGMVFLIRKAVPYMIERRYGKIINMAGGGTGGNPLPNFSAYTASKAAVVKLTETLANEYKEFNIDVNAIAPGAVNTKLLEDVLRAGKDVGEEFYKKSLKQKETGGVPREIAAKLAVYLASSDSDGLSGKLISAPHDDWKKFRRAENSEISKSAIYTLRRIDNWKFFEKKESREK